MIQGELFKNLTHTQIHNLLEQVPHTIKEYQANDCIYTEVNFKREIGMIVSGKASVAKTTYTGQDFIVKFINKGQLFALSTLSNQHESFPATIRAVTKCQVLHLTIEALYQLFNLQPSILQHFLDILGQNLLTLHHKIEILAIPSIKERVICWIAHERKNKNHIKINKSKLCQQLAISRASLYRILMELQEDDYIILNKDGSIRLLHENYF